MKNRGFSHIQIIALGYFIIITCGTLLLTLPFSARSGHSAGFLTALFTATSASCVTGLSLVDTFSYWAPFGQVVILALIQIGGLGFMTIATFFRRILFKKAGLRERAIMAESINTTRMSGFSSLIRKIVIGTAFFELFGAVLLSLRFVPRFGALKGVYFSLFHSVSAFCNAGFDFMGAISPRSSLTAFSGEVLVNLVIMALIIIGGIGFLVWDDITVSKWKWKRFSLHTKLVLVVSAFLTVGGALLFFLFETGNPDFAALPGKEKVLSSLFGSVTARTAGFNSVDTAALTPASKFLTVILMFIGGSPGSTAGGLKTTTFAVLVIYTFSGMRGTDAMHVFGRRVKDTLLRKAVIIFFLNLTLTIFGTLALCAAEGISITDCLFEATSAIGTVGMSTGITESLHFSSKIIIILLMYCGRVGSVSFAAALLEKKIKPAITYPTEDITVG